MLKNQHRGGKSKRARGRAEFFFLFFLSGSANSPVLFADWAIVTQ